ncbi:MAG: MBL fold metallo-hydrolase [Lachnospiraceae bacterium]|nr:MBL fold metallo-hydrolase [Lachnospiraceae bacterium]
MAQYKIYTRILGPIATNCYVIHEEESTQAVVIDPADQGSAIYQELTDKGLTVAGILLTHGHFDHMAGATDLQEKSGAKIYAASAEKALCADPALNLSLDFIGQRITVLPDVYLEDGEDVTLGGITFHTIFTPGHTEGSCCFYVEDADLLFAGDTLFCESIGRTDFPTSSMSSMRASLKKLMTLPESCTVYTGHGEVTAIGHEKKYNPFIS